MKYEKPITTPEEAYELVASYGRKPVEYFGVITLNGANVPIRVQSITKGILNRTIVHPREVFRPAILQMANSIIIFHNHPSGRSEVSKEDLDLTEQLKKAGELIGISVLDHLIVCRNTFKSLKEEGVL